MTANLPEVIAAIAPPRPVTPLSILVSHLQAAAQIAQTEAVPVKMLNHVQTALDLAAGLDRYLEACTTPESPELAAIAQKTREEPWNHSQSAHHLEQEMLSGQVEGQTLKLFVAMTRAKRVLDIGMFTGYSALAMAEALPADGVLIACEVDDYVANFAQELFDRSPHGSKIQIKLGAALETLSHLNEPFDLVFIDADKKEYVRYFQTVLELNLLSPNGIICVDNTLFQGQVYLPRSERSPNGQAIAEFNCTVADDPRVEQVLLPLRDGLTVIRWT